MLSPGMACRVEASPQSMGSTLDCKTLKQIKWSLHGLSPNDLPCACQCHCPSNSSPQPDEKPIFTGACPAVCCKQWVWVLVSSWLLLHRPLPAQKSQATSCPSRYSCECSRTLNYSQKTRSSVKLAVRAG